MTACLILEPRSREGEEGERGVGVVVGGGGGQGGHEGSAEGGKEADAVDETG